MIRHLFSWVILCCLVGCSAIQQDSHVGKGQDDKVRVTVIQRQSEAIPGFDDEVKIHIGDITTGQVLLSIRADEDNVLLSTTPVKPDNVVPFYYGKKKYYLRVVELRNFLIGDDFAVFEITTTPPPAKEVEVNHLNIDELLPILENSNDKNHFNAILRVREIKDEKAIPALEKVLRENINSTKIFRFAAAQALFCIGTKKAHQILQQYLLHEDYPVELSIRYTFHWELEESIRDAFISEYHLKNLSKDVSLKLNAETMANKKLLFTIILKNDSDKEIRLFKPQAYFGNYLLFKSPSGHFRNKFRTVEYKLGGRTIDESHPKLAPNEELTIQFEAIPKLKKRVYTKRLSPLAKPSNIFVLDCRDIDHILDSPGKYKVFALYAVNRIFSPEAPNIWFGRIVSNPIEIELNPVKEGYSP